MEAVDLVESEDECSVVTPIQRGHLKRKKSGSVECRGVKATAHADEEHCFCVGGDALDTQDASLALALKLQREENAKLRADEEYARRLQEEEQEDEVVLIGGSSSSVAIPSPDHEASVALARRLQEEEEEQRQQSAKRRAMLEDASLSQLDMVAAQICEAVRQLPGNAERPGGSCVNYDCARAFFHTS